MISRSLCSIVLFDRLARPARAVATRQRELPEDPPVPLLRSANGEPYNFKDEPLGCGPGVLLSPLLKSNRHAS